MERGRALGLLCLAQFMVILDTTIVNVALPAIQDELRFASQDGLQYVISLYALVFGGTLILAGRAADLFGRRLLFTAGLAVFAAASLACGLASRPAVLLTARAFQGLAGAMVSAAALALITTLFTEPPARDRALGAWGATGGAAGACGLILGGGPTDTLGWPWVFFINVPIGLIAPVFALRLLPSGRPTRRPAGHGRGLDLPGAVLLTTGLGLLLYGLTRGEQDGYAAPGVAALLAGAAALLAGFAVTERRVRRPLVRFAIFRTPGVPGALAAAMALNAVVASNLFFTTLYVQDVLGFSPLETGAAFLPNSVLVIAGSTLGSRLAGSTGAGTVLACGLAVLTAGCLLLSGISADGDYAADVLPGFALTGLGLGLAFVAVTIAATHGIDHQDQGLASGLVNTAQQVGFAIGIATVAAVAAARARSAGGDAAERAVSGYSTGYLIDAALAAAAVIVALVLVRRPTARPAGRV
ncbi:MFS transporter [Actinomadura rubrisoli]|uniref:MFS transporter n=1 Tax=Actinomadura rubrisoli TaxID=2530368 RepID=A0A4R5C1I1_9ACTN|nr:MFS transporter [Actinomadura rubrisoli]TDD92625.1 MFS transporter [Actinomadura rubrisoli]